MKKTQDTTTVKVLSKNDGYIVKFKADGKTVTLKPDMKKYGFDSYVDQDSAQRAFRKNRHNYGISKYEYQHV